MENLNETSSQEKGEELAKYLFPYDKMRNIQDELVKEVYTAVNEGSNLIVHAPTGLGKTAAALAPALKVAMENKKKIFFLTSRHTQHTIAIDTVREIKQKYDLDCTAIDMIGKKWMCTVPTVDKLNSGEFYDYCKKQRADGLCDQYNNTKKGNKLTAEAKLALTTLKNNNPHHIEKFSDLCGQDNLCAYELATTLAKDADVIVADYFYIYHPTIRDTFFNKMQASLADCIVIVDEGHNLPDRIRNLMTVQLSNYMIKRAINEAKKTGDTTIIEKLVGLQNILNEFGDNMRDGDERPVDKLDFIKKVSEIAPIDDVIADLEFAAQAVKESERNSSLNSIAGFLESWKGSNTGYVRIISQKQTRRESVVSISYRCLDPSLVSKEIIDNCHSTIIMSGTLTPTSMYKDILGFPANTTEKRYPSPFPEQNRLSMIIPETTTKFAARTPDMYRRIAEICAEVTNLVPGNCALFFPSYYLRNQVYETFSGLSTKTAFVEDTDMNKEEKSEFLERFKAYKDSGAVLLGVVSGSYGEGIDLPGDLLKCVVVVGLPLQQPSLETKELIKYYDDKFGKGWDYGYVAPAFSKTLQSAGRCIRSESDRGIVVFLDERYAWQNYFRHFPADWQIQTTKLYSDKIKEFFGKQ